MSVRLSRYVIEDSVENAVVGKYLHTATVKIIDTSSFPDDSLRAYVMGGNTEQIAQVVPQVLIWNFVKLAWSLPVTRQGTKFVMLHHQWESLIDISRIFITLFLIEALNGNSDMTTAEKKVEMFLLAICWLGPFTLSHYFAFRKNFWKVGGSLSKHLQVLLVRLSCHNFA